MTTDHHDLIIVMPVYEDRASASLLLRELATNTPQPSYVIIVEDGSVREPLQISSVSKAGLSGEVLHLRRNLGHQRAIATGLTYVAAHFKPDAVVVMDSDGEDRPDSISELIDELGKNKVDVVVARRRKRSEGLHFKVFYGIYRLIFQLLTGRIIRFGNFTALSGYAVHRLVAMPELWVHFAASLIVSRLRIGAVATDRGTRYVGKSQMNFVALSLHGLRSLMVFAEDVLVRVGLICAFLGFLAILLIMTAFTLKITGHATPGWFTAASGLLVLILIQAGTLIFVTLMLSGASRAGAPISRAQLDLLIDHIEKAALSCGSFPQTNNTSGADSAEQHESAQQSADARRLIAGA